MAFGAQCHSIAANTIQVTRREIAQQFSRLAKFEANSTKITRKKPHSELQPHWETD
jgi:hypothetical protein